MKGERKGTRSSGIGELTPELADALFEATNGDLELNMREQDFIGD